MRESKRHGSLDTLEPARMCLLVCFAEKYFAEGQAERVEEVYRDFFTRRMFPEAAALLDTAVDLHGDRMSPTFKRNCQSYAAQLMEWEEMPCQRLEPKVA